MDHQNHAPTPPAPNADAEGPDDGSLELEATLKAKGWWEKTVEYSFVRRVMPKDSDAFPMAGEPEASFGDLLLRAGNKFRLIEFKATPAGFGLEKKKYPLMFTPKGDDSPEHVEDGKFEDLLLKHHGTIARHRNRKAHMFVFGEMKGGRFFVMSRTYADKDAPYLGLSACVDVERLPSMTGDQMFAYLRALDAARGGRVGTGGLVLVGLTGGKSLLLTTQEFMGGFRLGLRAKAAADATSEALREKELSGKEAEAQAISSAMRAQIHRPNDADTLPPPAPPTGPRIKK